MNDLKERTIRGGFAKVCSQAANFLLRIGSLMVLARLLEPKDFGLVGMVTALIGVLNLFRDFGLSTATVQRKTVTDEQLSTLFWINMLVGIALGVISVAFAPVVAAFYHEPRLVAVTMALAAGFIFNAAGVQHSALLQRQMNFTALALIEFLSIFVSVAVAITMALKGFGYWALVAMTIIPPAISSICFWCLTAWIPGIPSKQTDIRSMLRFGVTITLNSLVVYIAYNLEKVLLGRFWGATALGIYGRSYQLINLPTENLNSAASGVVFAALSRLQDDHSRLKSYFLKAYSLVLALTIPSTVGFAFFANDLIGVVLGPKWIEAIPILHLLAPAIVVFALINPFWWLHISLGMVRRSLQVASVTGSLVIAGYVAGLSHGPKGVAFGYSAVLALWAVPCLAWCVRGTVVSLRDIMLVVSRPLLSTVVATGIAIGVQSFLGPSLSQLPRLILEVTVLLGAYVGMLFYVMGQKEIYMDLLRGLRRRSLAGESLASA
jgi:O-antigen/teichoic acid export membrane protein